MYLSHFLILTAIVFSYDYFPGAITLMSKHFSNPQPLNGFTSQFSMEGGSSRSFGSKGEPLLLFISVFHDLLTCTPFFPLSFVFSVSLLCHDRHLVCCVRNEQSQHTNPAIGESYLVLHCSAQLSSALYSQHWPSCSHY